MALISLCSVWQSVSGAQGGQPQSGQAVRHEGAQEGHHRAEGQDGRAYHDGEAGVGSRPQLPLPSHATLCLPDGLQAQPHSW